MQRTVFSRAGSSAILIIILVRGPNASETRHTGKELDLCRSTTFLAGQLPLKRARLPDGTAAVLPAEHAAALYVNEQPAFRVVCTPELLPQLALGRLLTEGWITSAQEVEQAAVCAEGLKVNVYLNHRG